MELEGTNKVNVIYFLSIYNIVAPSRLTRTIPSVAAFMTSLTVITIAMDRFRFIVCPHKTQVNKGDWIGHLITEWDELEKIFIEWDTL